MAYSLLLEHDGTSSFPAVQEGVSLTLERKGAPGILRFTVIEDDALVLEEGDRVKLSVNGTDMFYGFVFLKKATADGLISVTAYDQLRYLKNKDTFIGTGLKASDLLIRLAEDFHLRTGAIEDTRHVIDIIDEQNQTLFDMIYNALDETLQSTGRLYVLYDDVGRLCLRDIDQLKLGLVVDAETGESYSYESGIDSQTYDKVKLYYDNDKTGKRELYVAQDSGNIDRWGVLQYCEQLRSTTGATGQGGCFAPVVQRPHPLPDHQRGIRRRPGQGWLFRHRFARSARCYPEQLHGRPESSAHPQRRTPRNGFDPCRR